MRLRAMSLRAPLLLAALLVVAGTGYATYTASATANVQVSSASFAIVYTAFSDPGAPANIQTFAYSSLPSADPTLAISTLTGGDLVYVYYTVEDIGTLAAHNVYELPSAVSSTCDGAIQITQVGIGPTSLAPGVPVTSIFSVSDNAPPGPVPGGCPDPFSAVWHFTVTGTPV